VAIAGLWALALLCVLWETVLAPLRPGSFLLALKSLPLFLLLPGAMRGRRRSLQWLSLLLPFYLAEGLVRGFSEPGRHAVVALTAALIALATFLAVLAWARQSRD
jgi:uncharacterized membrane protein